MQVPDLTWYLIIIAAVVIVGYSFGLAEPVKKFADWLVHIPSFRQGLRPEIALDILVRLAVWFMIFELLKVVLAKK